MLKIGGVEVNGPAEELLILPRPMAEDIVIKARAVTDMSVFEALCPFPEVPKVLKKGGFQEDPQNSSYLEQIQDRSEKQICYMCIKSLEPSDIEWQTIDFDKPSTWKNWVSELKEAGISNVEIQRIQSCVAQANSLDDRKLEQARELFLRGLEAEQSLPSGPSTERPSTSSGQPASDSE